jgi:hypothetical protein
MTLGTAEILFVIFLEMVPQIVFASERSEMSWTFSVVARQLVLCFRRNVDVLIVAFKICWSLERGAF